MLQFLSSTDHLPVLLNIELSEFCQLEATFFLEKDGILDNAPQLFHLKHFKICGTLGLA